MRLVLLLLAGGLCACAEVKPWQRGTLADRCMQATPDAERAAARQHVLSVREGAVGGTGRSGAACGCN